MNAEPRENLWLKMLREFWADPKNVIGPPGALVRRVFKLLWFALSIYVIFWVAIPSQVASWRLWMHDDTLAQSLGIAFTLAGALCFSMVRYAAEGSKPIRVPLPLPIIEFEERKYKGWHIRFAHLHLPNITVATGSALVVGLFTISLLGMWNYYLHDNLSTGGASIAATEGATSSVSEAEAALAAHDEATAVARASRTRASAACDPGYSPTGCSRLEASHTAAAAEERQERARLEAALAAARGTTVTVATSYADPRPVDRIVAEATKLPRPLVASNLDLSRSAIVEALLILGAALSLAGSVSQLGVPREALSTDDKAGDEGEPVDATDGAPREPEPAPPPPRTRFVLPMATPEDLIAALAVGPAPRPTVEPPVDNGWDAPQNDGAPAADNDAPADEARPEPAEAADNDDFDDPLLRDALNRARAEENV